MPNSLRDLAIATVGLASLVFPTAGEAAAIKSPGCADLAAFGREVDLKQATPINKAEGRITIPTALAGPKVQQLFGVPALAWTPDDVAAASKLITDCGNQAKKAKDTVTYQGLQAAWAGVGAIRQTTGAIAGNQQKLEQWHKTLLQDEPSRPAVVVLTILSDAKDGTAAGIKRVLQELKDHSTRVNGWSPVHTHAQNFVTALNDAPTAAWDPLFPPLEKRAEELRRWAMKDAGDALAAVPMTPDGLRLLDNAVKKNKLELTGGLTPAQLADLDLAGAARRNAIEDDLAAKELAQINNAPANEQGLNALRAEQASPVRALLAANRVAALNTRLAARRDEIGNAVADEQIKRLDPFPDTLAGLREIDTFKNNTGRGLETLAGPAPAQRFREAATKRATEIGKAAFVTFNKALGEMPATAEGLTALDGALEQVRGPVGSLDASVRSQYLDAASKRRAEIVEAVQKEDARLAKLPLSGAVFAEPGGDGAKLEFRSGSKVYVTVFKDQTIAADYETDGDKVIVKLPGGNQVLTRDGAWIKGSGMNLKRQTAK